MDLNDRKKKILQAVIDEYIGTAEPVGSRAISKNRELGLSSATIRNEMADLEEMGYLVQPHTSAGRVPSDEGYRFYVNSLMTRYQMGMEAIERLHMELEQRVNQLDKMIRKASMLTSALTNYTTVVTMPEHNTAQILKADFIAIGGGKTIFVVITSAGTVRSRTIPLTLDSDACQQLSVIFTRMLMGLTADEIDFGRIQTLQDAVKAHIDLHPKILVSILNFVYETIQEFEDTEVYVDNVKSILSYPEYRDVDKAKEIFGLLEDKNKLKALMNGNDSRDGIRASIGSENQSEVLKNCSFVTVDYSLDHKVRGRLGVIGPKRMDYAKVFASLDLISTHIDKILDLYRGE